MNNSCLTPKDIEVIRQEEESLRYILKILRETDTRRATYSAYAEELTAIRRALPSAREDEIPELLTRFDLLELQVSASEQMGQPDPGSPYFARMILEDSGRREEILLGHTAFFEPASGIIIVDWKNAPLAGIFYTCRPGDRFSVPLPDDRVKNGILMERRILTIRDGILRKIVSGDPVLLRSASGEWNKPKRKKLTAEKGALASSSMPEWENEIPQRITDITALLDRKQYALLEKKDSDTLLLKGGAGSGKTTVLVHHLASRFALADDEKRFLFLVPEQGIALSCRNLLTEMRVRNIPVRLFSDWTRQLCTTLFKGLPVKTAPEAEENIVQFKRHPAMLTAIKSLASQRKNEFLNRLSAIKKIGPVLMELLKTISRKTLLAFIKESERVCSKFIAKNSDFHPLRKKMERFFTAELATLYDINSDRKELLLSEKLLLEAVGVSDGGLRQTEIKAVLERTMLQFRKSTDETVKELYGEKADSIRTLDDQTIDYATPLNLSGTVDAEDYTLMLLILREKTGGLYSANGEIPACTDLYLDETQEFSLLELELIRQAVLSTTRITASGDYSQLTRPVTAGAGWDMVLSTLKRKEAVPSELKINYRSTRQIQHFTTEVQGNYLEERPPAAEREGDPVRFTLFHNRQERDSILRESLITFRARHPEASAVLICMEEPEANDLFKSLAGIPGTRLVLDGNFSFLPGIDITTAPRIKGLEFDVVIIADAMPEYYPDSRYSRKYLYVSASRAMHHLWITAIGEFSPVVRGMVPG